MSIVQIALTLIFYVWLFVIAFLMWRHAIGGSAHVHRLQTMLNENAMKSVEAATKSAEAAQTAAEAAKRAVLLAERKADA